MNNADFSNLIHEDELSNIKGGIMITDAVGGYFPNASCGSDGSAFGLWEWMAH
ncbi:hypothetical protein [Fructobacillus parabroussonetiae]|uniref:Bacteriocin n=1 Tax=Fructobacillus parabroussonetiae TaxID=2713174 RepID=A0ABS5QXF9_9LACO|nr:hypothetical protein [Fructobacillus parabroussonetiae]MBS9337883.1 hypothetical protein [Fructobacillus parabroussonetiae]